MAISDEELEELKELLAQGKPAAAPGTRVGALNTLFSAITRPGRGVEQALFNVATTEGGLEDRLVSGAKGLVQGGFGGTPIMGTDVADLFLPKDTPAPLRAATGFGIDVLSDPLTYITGGGVKKGISKQAAYSKALRESAYSMPADMGTAARKQAIESLADSIRAEDPTRFYARVGVPFTSKQKTFESAKAYDVAEGLVKGVLQKEDGKYRLPARSFSRKAELPGISESVRRNEIRSASRFSNEMNAFDRIGKYLTDDQAKEIAIAMDLTKAEADKLSKKYGFDKYDTFEDPIEYLKTLPTSPEMQQATNGALTNLYDVSVLYKKIQDDYFKQLRGMGALTDADYKEKYVYRIYNKDPGYEIRPPKKGKVAGPDGAPFLMKRQKNVNLVEAEMRGLEPVMDIRELMKLRSAKQHQVVARTQVLYDALGEYGVRATKGNVAGLDPSKWISVKRALGDNQAFQGALEGLEDYVIPRNVADGLAKTQFILNDDRLSAEWIKLFNKAQSEWKFLATAMPQTEIRNAMSDTILNMTNGLLSPTPYKQSYRVMKAVKDGMLMDRVVAGGKVDYGTIKIGGRDVPVDKVWDLYSHSGGKSGFFGADRFAEDLRDTSQKGPIKNTYDKAKTFRTNVAETREDFFRLANFIHSLSEELGTKKVNFNAVTDYGIADKTLREAAKRAGDRVLKYNLDYGNLTQFERTVMRNVNPFYNFMRQSLPLQLELMLTRPAVLGIYPKATNLISQSFDVDPREAMSNDVLFPDWIRSLAPFVIAEAKDKEPSELSKFVKTLTGTDINSDVVMSLAGTPVETLRYLDPIDTAARGNIPQALGEAPQLLLEGSSPLPRTIMDLAYNKQLYGGGRISEKTTSGYAEMFAGTTPQTDVMWDIWKAASTGDTSPLPAMAIRRTTGLPIYRNDPKTKASAAIGEINRIQSMLNSVEPGSREENELLQRRRNLNAFIEQYKRSR